MTELSSQLSFFLEGASLMLLLIGLGVAIIMPGVDRWSKNFFISFFSVLAAYGTFTLVDLFIYNRPEMRFLLEFDFYFESLLSAVLMPMLMAYLLHCCGISLKTSRLFRLVIFLWLLYFITLNLTPFTKWFYYLSPENEFFRGPMYILMIGLIYSTMLLTLGTVIYFRKKLSRRFFLAFLIGLLPMIIAIFIHFFTSVFTFLGFGIAVCGLSMFFIILYGQIEQNLQQQREIAHQKASIMVLQMRPHFIYNAMTSIYYLCDQDPKMAQKVTLDFTTYLRKNFTAIASEETIPFTEELEHTQAYLAVEQAQFEDMLFVEYDTPHTQFRLPPLTLQPIVENAVKHGMDPDSDPLQIIIRTRDTASGSVLIVEDNGTGFDFPSTDNPHVTSSDNNEPHVALTNLRQRLAIMCGGELSISPREGGGTVVNVTVKN